MQYLGDFISDLSILLPVGAGLYFFKRLKPDRRWVLYFLLYTAFVEFTNAWMASRRIYNLWQINIFSLVEYSFFILLLNKWIKSVLMRWMSLVGSVLFLAFWFGYFITHKTLNTSFAASGTTENIVLMLLAGFVVTTISIETEQPVIKNYRFWFSAASFTYFAINVLMTVILARLIQNPDRYGFDVYIIHTVINILTNIIYGYVFYLKEE